MYLTVRGLVLRVTAYKETDAILTILTDGQGKLSVKARGLRRKNSPLIAACQLLAYGEFTLFEYRDMYTINEAHPIELFTPLRRDLSRLSLATYFAQVADVVSQEDIPNPELLSLTLNCLYALAQLDITEEQVKGVFELRVCCIAGYTPDIYQCYSCGNLYADRFDLLQGRLECACCRAADSNGVRLPVGSGALDAMRYICGCNDKKLFSFQASKASITQLQQISEGYLATQMERGFSALDFYKSLH